MPYTGREECATPFSYICDTDTAATWHFPFLLKVMLAVGGVIILVCCGVMVKKCSD